MAKSALELLKEYRAIVEAIVTENATFAVGDPVTVNDIGDGVVEKIRIDDAGDPIYTVKMHDPSSTASGIFYARDFELSDNSFNTCSECKGKGCDECYGTGKYAVGVNSDHYN